MRMLLIITHANYQYSDSARDEATIIQPSQVLTPTMASSSVLALQKGCGAFEEAVMNKVRIRSNHTDCKCSANDSQILFSPTPTSIASTKAEVRHKPRHITILVQCELPPDPKPAHSKAVSSSYFPYEATVCSEGKIFLR